MKLSDIIGVAKEVIKRHGDLTVQVQHSTELSISAPMVSIGLRLDDSGTPIAMMCHAAQDDDEIDLVENGVTVFKGTKEELKQWMSENEIK